MNFTAAESVMPDPPLETTLALLNRAKAGDADALNQLVERSLPPLRRWARGRLPASARDIAETQDLVQEAVMRTLPRLATFEVRHPGALQAFLRQAVSNHIIDNIRRVSRRPPITPALPEDAPDLGPSPLEHAIGRESSERYEEALKQLAPADREAIVARLELQQSYEEVALALGKPNANAARMAVLRAIRRLIEAMAKM
jgi:RNA polymerase sigma-70 factor (ECF subfamily)